MQTAWRKTRNWVCTQDLLAAARRTLDLKQEIRKSNPDLWPLWSTTSTNLQILTLASLTNHSAWSNLLVMFM